MTLVYFRQGSRQAISPHKVGCDGAGCDGCNGPGEWRWVGNAPDPIPGLQRAVNLHEQMIERLYHERRSRDIDDYKDVVAELAQSVTLAMHREREALRREWASRGELRQAPPGAVPLLDPETSSSSAASAAQALVLAKAFLRPAARRAGK